MFAKRFRHTTYPLMLLACVMALRAEAQQIQLVPPTVVHPAPDDADQNRIADVFDALLPSLTSDEPVRVIVSFTRPVTQAQVAAFEARGGAVRHVFKNVLYGFSGQIAAGEVRALSNELGGALNVIRRDRGGEQQLAHSLLQIRVRDWNDFDGDDAYVWDYGYTGDPSSSVAIAGSGITVAHDDLGDSPDDDVEGDADDWGNWSDTTNVIVGWYDATVDNAAAPRDINGHETLAAGVVAGRGNVDSTVTGVAPDARLVGLKFGYEDANGQYFYASDFIEVCDWVLATDSGTGRLNRDLYSIKVFNLSTLWDGDYGTMQAVEDLVANGVVVVVSGGNGHDDGPSNWAYNVAFPARSPKVIAVGATTTDYQGTGFLERITAYSSNGDPADTVIKPDLVAPGGDACCGGGAITGPTLLSTQLFDNFGACFQYESSYAGVFGPNSANGRSDHAFQFTASDSGAVDRVTIAVGAVHGGSFELDFWIADDSGGAPGSRNGDPWNYTFTSGGAWHFSGNQSSSLVAGQKYWLVMSVPASSADQEVAWFYNAIGDGGAGGASNSGGGGWAPYMGTRGAFRIRVNAGSDTFTHSAGTSFAAPHVAGVAALLIEALEDVGGAWQYSESEVMNVKAILQMTATELIASGEDPGNCNENGSDPQNNATDRGGKDRVEGYGRMNADAAIEAATRTWSVSNAEQTQLGVSEIAKKCWARQVTLTTAGNVHEIDLDVPDGADFDLYLYELTPAANGEPVVAYSSTIADTSDATNDESICVSVSSDTTYYVVVKWVQGDGTFTLSHASVNAIEVCDNGIDDDCDGLVDGDDPDCGGGGRTPLIVNGDFNSGALQPWTSSTSSNPGHPVPRVTLEDISPFQSSVHILRDPDMDGSGASIQQDVNAAIAVGAPVNLEFDVLVNSHNFDRYNSWNAYPANVWVVYLDALGDPYVVRRSFYNTVAPGHTPDPLPLAEQIPPGVWQHRVYDLSGVVPPIAEIVRIQAGSQGWSYDAAFDNFSLTTGGQPPCVGDLDGDGVIGLADLSIMLGNYGTTSGATPSDGDLDGDGDVDLADLAVMLSLFGTFCA